VSSSSTTSVRIHGELRQAILTGTLEPGARLRAEALAQRLKTSRTPVREALMLLAREGLVEILPRRGAVVSSFDAADLLDLYEVRALIEPAVARRATPRITHDAIQRLNEICELSEARGAASPEAVEDQIAYNDEFHETIIQAADSPRLTAALRAVAGIPHGFRTAFWRSDAQREVSQFCHRQLVVALADGKAELCEAVMRMHIVSATEFLADVVDVDAAD